MTAADPDDFDSYEPVACDELELTVDFENTAFCN